MPIVPSDSQNETPAAPLQPMTPVETSPTSGTGGLGASTVVAPTPAPPPSPVIPQQSSEPAQETNLFPLKNYEDVKIRSARATQYGKTPEQAARIFNAESKTGLPTPYIEENLEEVEKQADMQGFSAADFAKRSPKFASWVAQNPNNYALSKDDLDNGRDLESAVSDYSLMQSAHDSLYKGFADFNAGLAKLPAFAYDIAAVPQNLASKIPGLEGLETRAPQEWYNNSVTKYYEEASKISLDNNPDLQADMLEMISKKQYDRAGRAIFANVVTNAPNAIALMFGAGAGMKAASLGFAGAQTGAQSAGSEESQKVDPLTGTIAAVTKGGFEAVFEEMGTLSVLEKWSKGLMKKVGRTSGIEVIKKFSEMMISSFFQEGSEEAITSAAQDMTDYLTGINPDAIDGMGKRMLEAGIIGGFSGTGMTAPAGFGMSVIHARANKQTELQKNFYKAIGESAEASKVRERLPEKYREMAEKVMKDGPVENIYIPVDKFTELFQSYEDGGLPGAITELGIDKEFQEAKETGGLVKIKTSVWADKMAGTTHYNAASSDITFDPQSFTENESKEATKILADDTNTFDPSMFDGEKAIEGMTVQQQVQKMLEDTGMSPENARKNAIVHRFFNVFGKRLGKTAEQLFGEYNLSITRPVPTAQTNNFNPEDAAKNKDLAKYDPEVLKTILQDANETKGDASTFNPETNQRASGFRGGPAYIASSDYPTKDIQIAFNKASQGMDLTPYQNEIVQKLYNDSGYAPKKPFDPETILLQGGNEKDLIVQHNVTEKNIRHAMKMGGIPVPSLAVTKADSPLTNFGEITLIGSSNLINPKGGSGSKVFGADIYSPRYPRVSYDFTYKNFEKMSKELAPFGEKVGSRGIDQSSLEDQGPRYLEDNSAFMAFFLKKNGIEPRIETDKAPLDKVKAYKKAGLDKYYSEKNAYDFWDSEEFIAEATKFIEKDFSHPELKDLLKKFKKDEDYRNQSIKMLAKSIVEVGETVNGKSVNEYLTRDSMRDQIKKAKLKADLTAFAEQYFKDTLDHSETIPFGETRTGETRYVDHTIDNVVKAMSKDLRGGENFNYGVGSIRAHFTPEFTSVSNIKDHSHKLITEKEFENIKEEINREFFTIEEMLRSSHPAFAATSRFGFGDTVAMMMTDSSKMGLEKALKENGFNDVSEKDQAEIAQFLAKLKDLPTAYFEAKITRPVELNEFHGAVIPKSTSKEVKDILKDAGIRAVTYSTDSERRIAIKRLASDLSKKGLKTLFQSKEAPTQSPLGFFSQMQAEIQKMDFKSMPVKDFLNRLKNIPGIKAEEIEFSGLIDFLNIADRPDGKIEKWELKSFFDSNGGVKLEQVVLGEADRDVADSVSGMGDIVWGEQERDYSNQDDDISNELDYFLDKDNDWYKETEAEIRKDLLDNDAEDYGEWNIEVDPPEFVFESALAERNLKRDIEDKLRDRALDAATDSVENDEYRWRYTVDLEIDGGGRGNTYTLYGNDETGWYNSDAGDLGYNLNEAKIKMVAYLIDQGIIEGDKSQLIKADELEWNGIRSTVDYEENRESEIKFFKKNKARFIEAAKNDVDYWAGDAEPPTQDQIEDRAQSLADDEHSTLKTDPNDKKNNLKISINNDLLTAHIQGNNVKGWEVVYYPGRKKDGFNTDELQAKTIDDAKKEAIQHLVSKGLVTGSTPVEGGKSPDLPTGKAKFGTYIIKDGESDNYREFLLQLKFPKMGKFVYANHFSQENIVAHVRVTDREINGKKTLFIEEVQSDWHQQGRERGYKSKVDPELTKKRDELESHILDKVSPKLEKLLGKVDDLGFDSYSEARKAIILNDDWASRFDVASETDLISIGEEYKKSVASLKEIESEIKVQENGVPDAPLKQTDAWAALAMKRMMRVAVDGGYEAIAWTPGSVHSDRWGTDQIGWTKKDDHFLVGASELRGGNAGGMNMEEVARQRGILLERNGEIVKTKEDLQKVVSDTLNRERNDRSLQSLTDSIWKQMQENPSGERKPRAEGMEFMYDNMLKKVTEKMTKKLDPSVKVQRVGIEDTGKTKLRWIYTGPEKTIEELETLAKSGEVDSRIEMRALNGVIERMRDEGSTLEEALKYYTSVDLAKRLGGNLKEIQEKDPDIQSHFMEITPVMREKISEGFSLFQSADQIKRGRILFDSSGNFNIEFLKNADATTFLHETAHFFLEVYGDQASKPEAPAAVREDYAKILKYLGVQSRDHIGVDQHEKFAESWEKYLMEGNVPVSELREVFNTIKAWFVGVYKSIAAAYPGVKLSADIRGVFDRMLATEEEIDRARHEIQATPLIPNVDGVLSKEDAEKYVSLIEQERDIAADQARAKAMYTLTREMTKIRKAREIEIRKEVTAEVDKEPGQVMLTMIRTGQTPGREDLPSEFKNFKLSRRITNQLFDPKIVENLPNGIFIKDGQHPNVVAGLLMGPLASGADLITLLANTPNRKELIEQRTQEQMNQEFPDPIMDGSIVQNAMEAVHNEAGAERRNFEIDVMMKSKPAAVKGMIKKITDRKITVAQFRNRAEIIIGTTAIREIRPVVYMRGEIKHAKEAVRLFLKGDFDGAIEAKQKEILNHELYRVAIKAQEEVQKAQDRFNKVFQKDEKLAKNRDMAYINAARALLAEFKIGNSDYDADHYLSSIQKYFPEVYTQIKEIVDSSIANAADHRDVSFNVFMDMANTFKSLWDMSRLNHQITIDGMKMDRISAQDEMNTVLEDLSKDKGKGEEFARARNEKDERKFTFGAMKTALRRVETWVDQMDSGRIGGPFRKFIWEPVSGGVIQYRLAKNQTIAKFLKILKDHTKGFSEVSIPAKELVGLPNDAGVASPYLFQNKAELLGAMLHIGNESNLRKLLVGNGWGSLDEDGNLDTSNWDAFLKRMHSENVLQKEDYDFLQSAWDLMAELKPGAQKAHYEIYGYHFAEVTNHEFETPFGKYKGGYAPASIDRLRTKNAKAQLRAIEDGTSANMFPAPLNGFSKKRVENYTVPLSMNLNLLPMHVDQVLRFTHITPRVKDVTKMLFDKSFRANLEAFDPHVIDHFLLPWLQRSTSQSVVTPSGNRVVDRFFRKLRSKTGMATMFLNVTNTLQQYTGILVAAVKVAPKHLRNETWNFVKNSKEMSAFAYEKSDFMKTKINFQMSETQKEIVKILDKPTGSEKVSEWFEQNAYALQGLAQNQVDMIVWHAAYSQAQEEGINHKISVQLADSAVRTTQGTFGPEDVSMFETGSPMGRLFTMFSSYFNMLGNLLGSEYGKALQQELGMKKTALRAFYIYAAGFMIPAVMSEAILAAMSGKGLDADDDDDYLDDFMALFFGSQLKTGLALAPVAGPAVMAGINRFNTQQWDDRISLSPAVSMLEATVGVPYDISRDIEKGKLSKNTVRDALTLLSLMSGVPVLPFAKPVGYLQDVDSGRADPNNPLDFARGLITGKPGSK